MNRLKNPPLVSSVEGRTTRRHFARGLQLLLFAIFIGVGAAVVAQPTIEPEHEELPAGQQWQLVATMSDEFDGKSLDPTKWQADPEANGWGWYGRPPGLFRAQNVQLREGKLCVTVGPLESPIARGGRTYTHQGAIIRSLHPGRPGWFFECRMKANATVMSSTFWLVNKPGSRKKLELDIQECVGRTTKLTEPWARKWDQIFHSNLINWTTKPKTQRQASMPTPTKNHERFYVYGAWWKSPHEVRFYLDGTYAYSIRPDVEWDEPSYIQMAIETYDWNPVPPGETLIETGTWEQRTTQYDWVRTWRPVDALPADR